MKGTRLSWKNEKGQARKDFSKKPIRSESLFSVNLFTGKTYFWLPSKFIDTGAMAFDGNGSEGRQ